MKKVKRFVKQNGKRASRDTMKIQDLRLNIGAGDEARTRDTLLGKQMLYH